MKTRYALLTVDTEALPNRAESDHVNKLILGIHGINQAGVREMAQISAEFGAAMIFFLDICGAYPYLKEVKEVAIWLHTHGQDVQLHAHPEYLPKSFWTRYKRFQRPWYMNAYSRERSEFILGFFSRLLQSFIGKAPIAFRAGSFRWNANTLLAMEKYGFKLSFNNSMCAANNKQCTFSLPTNKPYAWSNGLIEIPMSEHNILSLLRKSWWARLQFPQSKFFRFRTGKFGFSPWSVNPNENLLVFLFHSWSFLFRDENGYEIFVDDRHLENYRNLLKYLSKECEIITTSELLDLIYTGKIALSHIQDVASAHMPPRKK